MGPSGQARARNRAASGASTSRRRRRPCRSGVDSEAAALCEGARRGIVHLGGEEGKREAVKRVCCCGGGGGRVALLTAFGGYLYALAFFCFIENDTRGLEGIGLWGLGCAVMRAVCAAVIPGFFLVHLVFHPAHGFLRDVT